MKDVVDFLIEVGKLKKLKRKGWVIREIPNPETVAEHSFRTSIMALVLAGKEGLDKEKCVKMALIHDLAEAIVGDVTPSDNVPKEERHSNEKNAMKDIINGLDNTEIIDLWREFEKKETPEAKFVAELDRVEAIIQAHEYRKEHDRNKDEIGLPIYEKSIQNEQLKKILDVIEEREKE